MTIKTFNINTDKTAFVRAYLPDSIAGLPFCEKRPAVLIFPGGGYEYCSDREGEPIALQYLALGYAAFVVTYSCNERFPEPLMDAAYIFYKIRMRAEEFKIDPQKMAVLGWPPRGALPQMNRRGTSRGLSRHHVERHRPYKDHRLRAGGSPAECGYTLLSGDQRSYRSP